MSERRPEREWCCYINDDTIWSIIQTHIPELLERLESLRR